MRLRDALQLRTLEQREGFAIAMFALPAVLLMLSVLVVPLAIVFGQAFSGADHGWSIEQFQRIFSRPMFGRMALNTLAIAVSATLFALLLAYPLAYYLAGKSPRQRALLTTLVLVPFWTSALVKSFAFVVLLGHSGVVNQLGGALGLPALPLLFNRTGVVIGMSHYLVPFMMFPILTNLIAQSANLKRAAGIMGASGWRIFVRVTLPMSLPGILSGSLLVFILSLGFYIIPSLLGGLHDMMLSNMVSFYASEAINWPLASALALLLTVAAAAAALFLTLIPGGSELLGKD